MVEAYDRLVFLHPFHWYSSPWTLKRWIDTVLTQDWAYGTQQALAGKTWLSAISVGASTHEYSVEGSRRYTVEEFLRPFERTAAFCGMIWQAPFLSYGGGYANPETIQESADALITLLEGNPGHAICHHDGDV